MTSQRVLPFGTLFLALVFQVGAPASTSAQDARLARGGAAVSTAVAAPAPTILQAHWSEVLQNRTRTMQLAFLAILLGMFILRWGGK